MCPFSEGSGAPDKRRSDSRLLSVVNEFIVTPALLCCNQVWDSKTGLHWQALPAANVGGNVSTILTCANPDNRPRVILVSTNRQLVAWDGDDYGKAFARRS
jgi:hypothetical protein